MRDECTPSVEELFQQALDRPEEERGAFLDEQCGPDPGRRAQVEDLLDHFAAATVGFLQRSARAAPATAGDIRSGDTIDRYKIVRAIGEGGMGLVYEAEQMQPINRRVALKIIKLGMDTKQVIGRFEAERQALAMMDYPGIAKVFDAGATESGRPYFVMELVRGVPITEYCDERSFDTADRLRLFVAVCHAVQHAHQKGIIHRDIKPSNVIITQRDGVPVPKVIDFGIAKATNQRLTERTMFTEFHVFIGTPAYMSPEQARMSELEVDTRSDIYSLGVLLYELLTGTTPLDLGTPGELDYEQMQRVIREVEPPTPSTRIGRTTRRRIEAAGGREETGATEMAGRRRTDPQTLRRQLRGDLDWIVMKALEKDPARRYETASALADDIERHERDEPVLAGPPSALYRLEKFAKRNKGLVAATAIVIVLLGSFVLMMYVNSLETRQLARSEREAKEQALAALDIAEHERQRADRELARSRIERGRLLGKTGSVYAAEDLLWPAYLREPSSTYALWALRELYSRQPLLASIATQKDPIWQLAMSPDGRTLASARDDGLVELLEPLPPRGITILTGHAVAVRSLGFSADGSVLASGDSSGTIMLWDVASHELIRTFGRQGVGAYSLCFSPDGARLAAGLGDGTVDIWDPGTGRRVNSLAEHTLLVSSVRFAPDGRLLATGSADSTIKLWADLSAPSTATLRGHTDEVTTMAFTPDGLTLVSGGRDKILRSWDVATGQSVHTLTRDSAVRFVGIDASGDELVSMTTWSTSFHDLSSFAVQTSIGLGARCAAWTPDGRILAGGYKGRPSLRWWEGPRSLAAVRLDGPVGRTVACFSRDGRIVASGDTAGTIRLWDAATFRCLAEFRAHDARIRSLVFDGSSSLLATAGFDGTVRVWDLATGRCLQAFADNDADATSQSVTFSADGRVLAFPGARGTIELRDVATGRLVVTIPATSYQSLSVDFSPDGMMLASTARDRSARLWSAAGELIATLRSPAASWTIEFSPDGERVAVGNWSQSIEIWNVSSQMLEGELEGHGGLVTSVAFSPADPELLASSSTDRTVRIWDLSERRLLATIEAVSGWQTASLDFSPDGRTLLVAGADGRVIACDLTYYDRHIAGNVDYQIAQLLPDLGDEIQEEALLARKAEVLRRPWPRLGGGAPADGRTISTGGVRGVDPEVIAEWGRSSVTDESKRQR